MVIQCLLITLAASVPSLQSGSPDGGSKSKKPAPKLVVVGEKSVDLGKIHEREKIDAVFTLENQGDADLEIKYIKSSCGCTTVKLTEKEKIIPPGARQDIVVTFDSRGRPGKQSKSVNLVTNDREQPRLTFQFTVFVETLFRTLPGEVYDFRNVRRGEQLARHIDILPAKEEGDLEVVSVNIPGVWFRHEVGPLPGSTRGARITLTVDEDAPLGRMKKTAEFTVRIGEVEETRELRLVGTVLGDLIVRPSVVKLERPTLRGNYLRPVLVTSSANDKPFDLLEVSVGPEFEATIEPQEDGAKFLVKLRLAETAPDGPCATMLEIRTDSLVQPLIQVPVFGYVAARLNIEPPLVLLRPGESAESGTRRVAIQNPRGDDFSILEVTTDQALLEAVQVDRPDRPTGARYVQITAKGDPTSGGQRLTVRLKTDLAGAEMVEIPVVIDQPKAGRRSAASK